MWTEVAAVDMLVVENADMRDWVLCISCETAEEEAREDVDKVETIDTGDGKFDSQSDTVGLESSIIGKIQPNSAAACRVVVASIPPSLAACARAPALGERRRRAG